jgi:tetraacyldisaccharide 4'-kinase
MVTGDSDPALVGDEPVLIALRTGCPLAVAPHRNLAARALLDKHACDVLICDDGLQHYSLIRNVEIVVIDGNKGLGNGWSLPAGPLRESPARLREVDFVVSQGACAAARYTMTLRGEHVVNLADASRFALLDDFGAGYVHAVAGIGNPMRFFNMLKASGLAIRAHTFANHHSFTPADLNFGDARPVLMTEKDAVKCRAFAKSHHWYLPVTAVLAPRLAQEIIDLLRLREPTAASNGEPLETRKRGQKTARYPGLSRH